jgi:hypothetical protein
MNLLFWIPFSLALIFYTWLFRGLFRKPKPSPVRALCCLCLQFHDGTGTHCEACEFAYYPDGVTYFQVEQLVDGVQYRTEK